MRQPPPPPPSGHTPPHNEPNDQPRNPPAPLQPPPPDARDQAVQQPPPPDARDQAVQQPPPPDARDQAVQQPPPPTSPPTAHTPLAPPPGAHAQQPLQPPTTTPTSDFSRPIAGQVYPPPPPAAAAPWQAPGSPPPPAGIAGTSQPPPPRADAVPLSSADSPGQYTSNKMVTNLYNHQLSRWGLGDVFASLGVYFTASIGLAVLLITIVGDDFLEGPLLPLVVVGPHVALLLHTTWVARTKGRGLVNDFQLKLTGSDIGLGLGLFVAGLIAATMVGLLVVRLLDDELSSAAIDVARDSTDDRLTIWLYLFAFLGATFVPLVEELVYRGLLWSALEKRGVRPIWILVITSALFAFVHLELTRTPVLFVLGLALGAGRLYTGRIGASIVTHVLINAIAMTAILVELS